MLYSNRMPQVSLWNFILRRYSTVNFKQYYWKMETTQNTQQLNHKVEDHVKLQKRVIKCWSALCTEVGFGAGNFMAWVSTRHNAKHKVECHKVRCHWTLEQWERSPCGDESCFSICSLMNESKNSKRTLTAWFYWAMKLIFCGSGVLSSTKAKS